MNTIVVIANRSSTPTPWSLVGKKLETNLASSKYSRKKSALEREFVSFLHRLSPPKSLDCVSPREILVRIKVQRQKHSHPVDAPDA